jgi:hypothetical protein
MNTIRAAVVLLLGVLLSGCTGIGAVQPICDEIIALRAQISRAGSPEQLRTWIVDSYKITQESIEMHSGLQQEVRLLWHRADQWYSMSIENGAVAEIGAQIRGLSAADVIACLGQPGQYRATYGYETEGGTQLDFAMLFPDQGILAGGAKILRARPAQPPAITSDFPIEGFQFMRPGPVSTLLQQAHSVYTPALREQMINAYKPWPGDWQGIMIGQSSNVSP